MEAYSIGGRSVITAATANHVGAALWNPSANVQLSVFEVHWFKTAAVADNIALARITTRGTAGSSIVVNANNNFGRNKSAPLSGAILDLAAYTVQPTVADRNFYRNNLPAAIGAGVAYVFRREWVIAPGEGLAILTPVAVALQVGDVSFYWEE